MGHAIFATDVVPGGGWHGREYRNQGVRGADARDVARSQSRRFVGGAVREQEKDVGRMRKSMGQSGEAGGDLAKTRVRSRCRNAGVRAVRPSHRSRVVVWCFEAKMALSLGGRRAGGNTDSRWATG